MKITFKEAVRIENFEAKFAFKARVAIKPNLTKKYSSTAFFQWFSERYNNILGQTVSSSPFLAVYVQCSPFCCEGFTLNYVIPLKLVSFPSYGFPSGSTQLAKVGGTKEMMGSVLV